MKVPAAIQTYRGFGNARLSHVAGQVSFGRRSRMREPSGRDRRQRLWGRVRDALRLAISPRVARARVRIRCGGASIEVETDEHGHFEACLEHPFPDPGTTFAWRACEVELLEPASTEPVSDRAEILLPGPAARRVVVSDIDDTVVFTGVSNKLKMLWRLFAEGAEDRVPFPGIAALYRGLHAGKGGHEDNPMVYVSRSPWAIYPTLEAFFQEHDIPIGPVLRLRDWGITLTHPFPRRGKGHKRTMLLRVLDAFDGLPLLLIGDSGQRDPEIYAQLAREHPDRVDAIYVRDLGLSGSRSAGLQDLQREMAGLGVAFVVAPDSHRMAVDAAERGWIPEASLTEVDAHVSRQVP